MLFALICLFMIFIIITYFMFFLFLFINNNLPITSQLGNQLPVFSFLSTTGSQIQMISQLLCSVLLDPICFFIDFSLTTVFLVFLNRVNPCILVDFLPSLGEIIKNKWTKRKRLISLDNLTNYFSVLIYIFASFSSFSISYSLILTPMLIAVNADMLQVHVEYSRLILRRGFAEASCEQVNRTIRS